MADTAKADRQADAKPVSIRFEGVGQDAVDTLAQAIEPVLDEVLDRTGNDHVRAAVAKTRATLASPRRRSFRWLQIDFAALRFTCGHYAPGAAAALDRVAEQVGELTFAEYRADVDSGHVDRALRILADRAPAAYNAVRAALAADPGIEVKSR